MNLEKIYSITDTWFKNVHSNDASTYSIIFKNCLNIVTKQIINLQKDDIICFSSYISFLITENIKEENDIYSHINELCVEYSQKECDNKRFFFNAFNKYISNPSDNYNYNQTNILLAIYDRIYYLLKNNFKILLRTFLIIKKEFLKFLAIILSFVIFNLIYQYINLPTLNMVFYTILTIFTVNIFIEGDVKVQLKKLHKIKFERYTLVFQYLHNKLKDI